MVDSSRLQALLAHTGEPCVTLMLPTARTGRGVWEGPIRFKNLMQELRDQLAGEPSTAAALEDAVQWLVDEVSADGFWEQQRDGLVLLASPTIREAWRLPFEVPERVHVGERFQLLHAMHAAESPEFELVCFSRGAVRAFRGDASHIAPLTVPDLPPDLETFLRFDEKEAQLQSHSIGPGGGARPPVARHGHGVGHDDRTNDLRRFAKAVVAAVEARRNGRPQVPLVLAAPERDGAAYRAEAQDPGLLEACLHGNFDHTGAEELRERAWEIVAIDWHVRRMEVAAEVHGAVEAGRGTRDVEEVLDAAHQGRVRTLVVARDGSLHGSYDSASGRLSLEPSEATDDLVDLAACAAARTGAEVVTADIEDAPGLEVEAPLAAVLH